MMPPSPSRLIDAHRVLVVDTSVVINLLGTARPADILRSLNSEVIVEEVARREVRRDPATGQPARETVDALVAAGTSHHYANVRHRL